MNGYKHNFRLQLILLAIAVVLLVQPFLLLYFALIVGPIQFVASTVFFIRKRTRLPMIRFHWISSVVVLTFLFTLDFWESTLNFPNRDSEVFIYFFFASPAILAILFTYASYQLYDNSKKK